MPSHTQQTELPQPSTELMAHSQQLQAVLDEQIQKTECIPFVEYMERVLYEPGLGYYSAGLHKFGAEGDFVTAPELGPIFAQCLSSQIAEIAASLNSYDILEVGAGSGQLAADLLNHLPDEQQPSRYRILERSADLRQQQQATIKALAPQHLDRVEWLDRPPEQNWKGVVIANEVIDALAVERFQIETGEIKRQSVNKDEAGYHWQLSEMPENRRKQIAATLADLPQMPEDGYRSEWIPGLPEWLQSISSTLEEGVLLFIDYGYPRKEFYMPGRKEGTLICHYRHRGHDNPFFWPGLQDITAFVDFTAVAEAAEASQLELLGYTSQAMFLMGCDLDQIASELMADANDKDRFALADQIKTLTMPGEMGERFQVMALGRGFSQNLRGFSLLDLSHRL